MKRDSLSAHSNRAQLLNPIGGVGRTDLEAEVEVKVSVVMRVRKEVWVCILNSYGSNFQLGDLLVALT